MEQCHTSKDVLRKAPREQYVESFCRNLQHPPGPQTPDTCALGSYKQDISLWRQFLSSS